MGPQSFESVPDDESRDRLYRAISSEVVELVRGKVPRVGREMGRDVLERVTEIIFTALLRDGYFRFPSGYGSLKVQRLKRHPQPKRLPTGEVVELPSNRVKLRYEEGAAVREALGLPPKTNYKRRFSRESVLSARSKGYLDGTV